MKWTGLGVAYACILLLCNPDILTRGKIYEVSMTKLTACWLIECIKVVFCLVVAIRDCGGVHSFVDYCRGDLLASYVQVFQDKLYKGLLYACLASWIVSIVALVFSYFSTGLTTLGTSLCMAKTPENFAITLLDLSFNLLQWVGIIAASSQIVETKSPRIRKRFLWCLHLCLIGAFKYATVLCLSSVTSTGCTLLTGFSSQTLVSIVFRGFGLLTICLVAPKSNHHDFGLTMCILWSEMSAFALTEYSGTFVIIVFLHFITICDDILPSKGLFEPVPPTTTETSSPSLEESTPAEIQDSRDNWRHRLSCRV